MADSSAFKAAATAFRNVFTVNDPSPYCFLMASSVSSMSFVRAATVASSTSAHRWGFRVLARAPARASRFLAFLVQQCWAPPIGGGARASSARVNLQIGSSRNRYGRVLSQQGRRRLNCVAARCLCPSRRAKV